MSSVVKQSLWWHFNSSRPQYSQYHSQGRAWDNIVSYTEHNVWQTPIWNRILRNNAKDIPTPLSETVIIKHKYDDETGQENQTGEMTVNISAVFVL